MVAIKITLGVLIVSILFVTAIFYSTKFKK